MVMRPVWAALPIVIVAPTAPAIVVLRAEARVRVAPAVVEPRVMRLAAPSLKRPIVPPVPTIVTPPAALPVRVIAPTAALPMLMTAGELPVARL